MALIKDDLTVFSNKIANLPLLPEALDHSDINQFSRLGPSATNLTDLFLIHV